MFPSVFELSAGSEGEKLGGVNVSHLNSSLFELFRSANLSYILHSRVLVNVVSYGHFIITMSSNSTTRLRVTGLKETLKFKWHSAHL